MFPLKSLLKWQKFAQLAPATKLYFAVSKGFCDADRARKVAVHCSDSMQTCYPFPLPWPGPLWVRSFFLRDGTADSTWQRRFGAWSARMCDLVFQIHQNLIESASINNKIRGDLSCVNPLSFSALQPLVCLAASTTTSHAALLVRRRAVCWPMLPMETLLPARYLELLRALFVTISAFAAHATDLFAALRAHLAFSTTQWPFAQFARVAILVSSPRARRSAFCFSKRDSHV